MRNVSSATNSIGNRTDGDLGWPTTEWDLHLPPPRSAPKIVTPFPLPGTARTALIANGRRLQSLTYSGGAGALSSYVTLSPQDRAPRLRLDEAAVEIAAAGAALYQTLT